MEYCKFIEEVKAEVKKLCGDNYDISVQEVLKNNGCLLKGLSFCRKGEEGYFASPVIYLEPYYWRYLRSGLSAACAAEEILAVVIDCAVDSPCVSSLASGLTDFEKAKDRIIYRLVDKEGNRELLKSVPFAPYCDLAVIFYIYLGEDVCHHLAARITKDHMELWKTDVDTLYKLAKKNTPRMFPPVIKTMNEVLKEIVKSQIGDACDKAFADETFEETNMDAAHKYVLTNQDRINGACIILYDGLLKGFAEKIGSDLVILPSSCHEVIVIPYKDDMDAAELEDMVRGINDSEVPPEDVLSNSVYRYSRVTDSVNVMSGSGAGGRKQGKDLEIRKEPLMPDFAI